ncbi:MAG: helix-turn-helix transcriptional regulator [Lachnospiraceae bacterium]|nr:helix-turn-helix transcriptional regulator [Lachnospiraceae bacterium]
MDISVNFLSEIENGKRGMSQDTLYKLCSKFAVSADYI